MERSRSSVRALEEKAPLMMEQPLLPDEELEEGTRDYVLPSSPVSVEEPTVQYPYMPAPDYHQSEPESVLAVPPSSPRPLPKLLSEALWVLIDHVRADPTYARNLRVRLATFQGNDVGPLTAILDAMAAEDTR